MKSSIVNIVVTLGLSAALGPVALQAEDRFRASIPFDFTVGAKSFTAGNYRVEQMNDYLLRIRNVDNLDNVVMLVTPGEKSRQPGTCVMRFHRYGDRYFLSEVASSNQGFRFHKSAAEKELIREAGSSKPPVMVAALGPK